ncbi:OmpA family protein [Rhodobacteraceae bacterium]|nr:OmpA family protein [Paracoccaceae bacterium]
MRIKIMTTVAFASAIVSSGLLAGGVATFIEKRSRSEVETALGTAGHDWATTKTNGLQVQISGTAPSEAERFRTLTLAASIVEPTRIVDNTEVAQPDSIAAPEFSLEILRNDDGISLIGLVPADTDRAAMITTLSDLNNTEGSVVDMLDTADYPVPDGWEAAYAYGIEALKVLPHSKISVDAGHVKITAITSSKREKAQMETQLMRTRPENVELDYNISAPRPVITPFTLRFVIDENGARFDACSADTDRARTTILEAARAAGISGDPGCTVGMGVPSPDWTQAVTMGISTLSDLGAGVITYSDADIALSVPATVPADLFEREVGELESNLPDVFSLQSTRERPAQAETQVAQFSASLASGGQVSMRGRVTDELQRETLENFARAQFGVSSIAGGTRVDDTLPTSWSVRTMAALTALNELNTGDVTVRADRIDISGISGNARASDEIARLLSQRLGEGATINLSVRYDKRLDPTLGLPSGAECVARLNDVLKKQKISFEPGSSTIAADGAQPLNALAQAMKNCEDYRMEMGGHTDSQGSNDMNRRLSQQRADAVLRGLAERGVAVENLSARGYGESQPIADNGTAAGREANRRIEYVLLDEAPIAQPEAMPEATASATEAITSTAPGAEGTTGDTAGADTDATPTLNEDGSVRVAPGAQSPARPKARPENLSNDN